MYDETCSYCGGAKVPIGYSVKCFDCGRCYGEEPGKTYRLRVLVGAEDRNWRFAGFEETPDILRFRRGGREIRVRATQLCAGTGGTPPLRPNLHPSLYEGVDRVGVFFRDIDSIELYEAVPYSQRSFVGKESGAV